MIINTTGNNNTAVGYASLGNNNASFNTALGANSLEQNTNGANNTALGNRAMQQNTIGNFNTAVGFDALISATSASSNTSVGYSSSIGTTTGSQNTALGYQANSQNTTGSNNTAIGYNAGVNSGALTNATAIGANAVVNSSNALVLGNNVNVGIGTSSPAYKLDVAGTARFTGTVQIGTYTLPNTDGAINYVLKTNGAGVVSWQPDNTAAGTVTGSGTAGYLPRWSSASALTNSVIYDNGTNVVVGVGQPAVTGGSSRTLTIGATNVYSTDDAALELVGGGASSLDTLGKIVFVATTPGPTYTTEAMMYGARGGDLVFLTRSSALVERMRILGNGNVGIGTSNPQAPLEVATDGSLLYGMRVSNQGSTVGPTIYMDGQTKDWTVTATNAASGAGPNKFVIRNYSDAQDILTLTPTGEMGIGVTAPNYKIQVYGTGTMGLQITNANTGAGYTDGAVMSIDNTSRFVLQNNEVGGVLIKDGSANSIWINSGTVGINTTSAPVYPLQVYNGWGHQALQVNSDGAVIGDVDGNSFGNYFRVDFEGSPRFMFMGANTGFDITSPTARVHVHGSSSSSSAFAMKVENSSNAVHFAVRDDGFMGMGPTATAPTSTLDISGSLSLSGQAVVSSVSTFTPTAFQTVIFVSVTGATINLPAANSCKGRIYYIKETAAFLNTTVQSGSNIDGSTSYVMGSTGVRQGVQVVSDGTTWWTISVF
jgi:hypothetical protein